MIDRKKNLLREWFGCMCNESELDINETEPELTVVERLGFSAYMQEYQKLFENSPVKFTYTRTQDM